MTETQGGLHRARRQRPPSVRLVSAADKLHNARAILGDYRQVGEALWDRFTGKRRGTLWYYRALADVFLAIESTPLIEELDRTVAELEHVVTVPSGDGCAPQPIVRARRMKLIGRPP